MKLKIFLLFFILCNILTAQVNSNYHKVKGYYRKNGTYVEPHYRTNPNNTNRDNYSTRPNTNPHTGEKGYIAPDNKSYSSYPSSYYNNSYKSKQKTYKNRNSSVSFYTNYGQGGNTQIWVDGSYKGRLTSYFRSGNPNCGQSGTLKVDLEPGTHYYKAKDVAGFTWKGSITTNSNNCQSFKFNSSKERRFNLGKESAKKHYSTSFYNYIIPFAVSAYDPYYGIGTTVTINLFRPYYRGSRDKNYDKGYIKTARKKKIIVTLISCGLGLITNRLIQKNNTEDPYRY